MKKKTGLAERVGLTDERLHYKKYSNILTTVKNLAKKLYYHNKLNEFRSIPKKTWQLLRFLLPASSNSGIT